MAGIGLQLGRMLGNNSYAGLLGAYGYAGLVSAGPWVLSIVGMLALGALASGTAAGRASELLVAITWSTAGSLILTGPLHLVFGRFVADCSYEERHELILPNLLVIALFAAGNLVFTLVTQTLGPDWYGFGFATAALLASAVGLPTLSRKLERLDREIFMRQPLWPTSRRSSRTRTGEPSSTPSHAVSSRREP